MQSKDRRLASDSSAHIRDASDFLSRGKLPAARTALLTALKSDPNSLPAMQLLGIVLCEQGKHEEALTYLQRAVATAPTRASVRSNLAKALHLAGQLSPALVEFQIARRLAPQVAQVHLGLGNVLLDLGMDDKALTSYLEALRCAPDLADAHLNAAKILASRDEHGAAKKAFDRFLELEPEAADGLFGRVASQQALCDWDGYEERVARLIQLVRQGRSPSGSAFLLTTICDDNQVLKRAAQREASFLSSKLKIPFRKPTVRPEARIHIAYVSADFRTHAISHLAAGLFEAHDRKRFEVIGISLGADDGSPIRERVVKSFDRFEDVCGQTSDAIASRIRDLRVDIAVDLMGYTRKAKPAIFLNRVAPIQVNFLGFPGTSGMQSMDYIVVDPYIATDDFQKHVSERPVILPDSYQVNDDIRLINPHTPSREQEGLPSTGFVFCCFNHVRKITPRIFDVWMRILRNVDRSVLWLLAAAPPAVANLQAAAEARGVRANRLVFAEHRELDQHLARIRLADLFLDTFPYTAHTTASDALWVGCPIVSLVGNTFASRVCGSLLRTVGLPELAVFSLDAYETLALRLATQPEELITLKARLAEYRRTSPLFDTKRFCRNIEVAYLEMARIAAGGKRPTEIDVRKLSRALP